VLAALVWLFWGSTLLDWYLDILMPPAGM
jgi:hypothetical protein